MKWMLLACLLLVACQSLQQRRCQEYQDQKLKQFQKIELKNGDFSIFFYWPNKEIDNPVVFLNGGPGRSSHVTFDYIQPLAKKHGLDVLYFDQRGTGCSGKYPEATTPEKLVQLSHYGSGEIVDDLELVRKKYFKNKKWILFGQSYGGMIAYRYIEKHPEALDAVVVHGATMLQQRQNSWLERLKSQERIGKDYLKKYPGDAEKIRKIQSEIGNTCFESGETKVCGPGIFDASVILLGFQDQWSTLHDWIETLSTSKGTRFHADLEKFTFDVLFEAYLGPGASFASLIEWIENPNASQEDECAVAQKQMQKEGLNPEEFYWNECRIFTKFDQKFYRFFDQVKVPQNPFSLDKVAESLKKHKNIQLYVFSSEKDNFIPKESFQQQREKLGKRMHYEVLPGGHEGFYSSPRIWQVLSDLAHQK